MIARWAVGGGRWMVNRKELTPAFSINTMVQSTSIPAGTVMQFEWDDAKNERNISLHGIDFADVWQMFNYPMLTDLDDRFDYGEDRWVSIGILDPGIAVIIWTERDADTIRIISARKANRYERQRYERYITNQLGSSTNDG
jgi:uncharacterized DUF497 family protein